MLRLVVSLICIQLAFAAYAQADENGSTLTRSVFVPFSQLKDSDDQERLADFSPMTIVPSQTVNQSYDFLDTQLSMASQLMARPEVVSTSVVSITDDPTALSAQSKSLNQLSLDDYQYQNNTTVDDGTVHVISLKARYQYGRFATESGVSQFDSDYTDAKQFYVQSSFAIVQKQAFNLSVLAKIESLEQPSNEFGQWGATTPLFEYSFEPMTNTTIGVVGAYNLTQRWSVIGAITSSAVHNTDQNHPLNNNQNNRALIGTSYSF